VRHFAPSSGQDRYTLADVMKRPAKMRAALRR